MAPLVRRMAPAALAFSTLLAACSDSSTSPAEIPDGVDLNPGHQLMAAGEVNLSASMDASAPGSSVTLHLENQSGEPIGYNLCFHALEVRDGDRWELLPNPRVCTAHMDGLEHGAQDTYPTTLPDDLEEGEYRFRAAIYFVESGTMRDQVTAGFTVEG